ncbi:MAG1360 family OppF-related protein [Mycoplasmopsis edwardii]|uniref:Uncharacterized protein n=1 Tax=Mycoplasmopsis edwardii TaxID=53558 RepID=A0ACD4PHT8_9BACT|nr:hypothetical protein [Mycoplasmopsis edwardii]WBP84226.1 hypothetical protein Me_995_000200 [Mycoplasmopsis edwardii]
MKSNNFLKISNIFENFEKPYTLKNENNTKLEHYINIPEIYLDKRSTAFYISRNNKNLNFKNIWKSLKSNKNSTIFFKNLIDGKETFLTKKADIFKKIAFVDFHEEDNNTNNILPFVDIWQACVDSYENNKKEFDLRIFNKDFELTMKNSFFSKISFYSNSIHSINLSYETYFSNIIRQFHEKQGKNKYSHESIINLLNSTKGTLSEYRFLMSDTLIAFFKELKENHTRLIDEYEKTDFNLSRKSIEQNQTALRYMKKINHSSIQKVWADIQKRDIETELNFFKSYKAKITKKNKTYILSIIKKIKGERKILKIKLMNLPRDDDKWLEVYKNLLIKKSLVKFWKKHFKDILYLKTNMIFELENYINHEIKMFSENRFFPILKSKKSKYEKIKRIKEVVHYEFDIQIDLYTSESNKTKAKINNEFQCLYNKKKELSNLVFTRKEITAEKSSIFNFEQSIKLAEAEVRWSDSSQEKLFNSFLNKKELKVSKLEKNIKNYKKMIDPLLNLIESAVSKSFDPKAIRETPVYNEIKRLKKLLTFKEWALDLLISLAKFTSSKGRVPKSLEIEYLASLKFINIYENISIKIDKFFEPYKNLDFKDRFKLKFVKHSLEGIKILFVQDDEENVSYDSKKEILRTLNNISDKFKNSFVFITDDLEIIEDLFDEVYFFDDYKLIEWGSQKEIKKKPINPFVYELIKKGRVGEQLNEMYRNNQFYINDGVITAGNKKHFVLASLQDFDRWIIKNYNDSKLRFLNDSKVISPSQKTKTTEAVIMKGYFDGNEVFLDEVNEDYYDSYLQKSYMVDDYVNWSKENEQNKHEVSQEEAEKVV